MGIRVFKIILLKLFNSLSDLFPEIRSRIDLGEKDSSFQILAEFFRHIPQSYIKVEHWLIGENTDGHGGGIIVEYQNIIILDALL